MSKNDKLTINEEDSDSGDYTGLLLVVSFLVMALVVLIAFLSGKVKFANSFLLGALTEIIYLRMQILYTKNLLKKDWASKFVAFLSMGRIFIVAACLYIAMKRTDLFDFLITICGLFSMHLVSTFVIAYKTFSNNKKKQIIKET